MNFYQLGDDLLLIGGYGNSGRLDAFITHPVASAIKVSEIITVVITRENPIPIVQFIEAEHFAITGGQIDEINGEFFLVGGCRFDGRYNPMGPDQGPVFSRQYTDKIQKFRVMN